MEKTDKMPQGKRDDISLREKEKLIRKDLDDEIVPRSGEMTVLELVKNISYRKQEYSTIPKPIIILWSTSSKKRISGRRELTK